MNQESIEAEPKEATKNHGIMAHEKQFFEKGGGGGGAEGDLENCAYLWKILATLSFFISSKE